MSTTLKLALFVCALLCLVLASVVGIGFMVLMCLGALACCIHKGSQPPEENIMVSHECNGKTAPLPTFLLLWDC